MITRARRVSACPCICKESGKRISYLTRGCITHARDLALHLMVHGREGYVRYTAVHLIAELLHHKGRLWDNNGGGQANIQD